MFNKRKKKNGAIDEDEVYEDVDDTTDVDSEDDFDDPLFDEDVSEDDDTSSKSIKKKYNSISRMFHKHLIYVRIAMLIGLTVILGGSLIGGVVMGLQTQSAKAKQVTPFNTQLQFSKTGAAITVGQAYRSGETLLIPIYNDGVTPIDTSLKASASGGSFAGVSSGVTLPSYGGNGSGSTSTAFVPLSAKNYRMYVSALKGSANPATEAKYVKFGATGIGALILSNVSSDVTLRTLIENTKVYSVPGASAPGLTVDGHPVDTKRDVVLINSNLSSAKQSGRPFTINSDAKTLLKVAFGDDYMKLWNSDKNVLTKLEKVDSRKLLELQSNKESLNAGDKAQSDNATSADGQQNPAENAIMAQQTIVNSDKDSQTELDKSKAALNEYINTVANQMTQSTNAQVVR